jgi:hypothetical protein
MTIDCTLNGLKIAGFPGFDAPFGTKKATMQPLTGEEANTNALLPFKFMRPLTVSENSTTTQIQVNCVFEFTTGGITLTLGNASFAGCRVSVINSALTDATVASGGVSIPVRAKEAINLVFINGAWRPVDDYSDIAGLLSFAIDQAGLANREGQKTIKQRIQSGAVLIKNRGVKSGCAVTKSTTAIRNLNLNSGAIFMNGMELSVPVFNNAALVPANNSGASQTCYAYIYLDTTGKVKFACTGLGESVPDDGMELYRLTVPAANTETSDPQLANITLTSTCRVEAAYPVQFNSIAYASIALPFAMLDGDYEVVIELQSFKGGAAQRSMVYPGDKAANGFKIYAEGTLDMVNVRWTAIKNSL